MKVLIVDDEEMIRNVLKEYVEFEGGEAYEAADGMQAVKMCREADFDIILMDVMLPRLDGFSAVKEIKKTKNIPVIMLSARGEEYDKLFGFEIRGRRLRNQAVFAKRGNGAHTRGAQTLRRQNHRRRGKFRGAYNRYGGAQRVRGRRKGRTHSQGV